MKNVIFFNEISKIFDNLNPHSISSTNNGLANGFKRHELAKRVRLLHLGNLEDMADRDRGGDNVAGAAAAGFDPGGLLDEPGHRRRLHGELKGVVLEGGDGHGHWSLRLVLLRSGVEILAESHQI